MILHNSPLHYISTCDLQNHNVGVEGWEKKQNGVYGFCFFLQKKRVIISGAERYGKIIKLFDQYCYWDSVCYIFKFLIFCFIRYTQAINHSIVWPTQNWIQSTYKLLFQIRLGLCVVMKWEELQSLFSYWIVKTFNHSKY